MKWRQYFHIHRCYYNIDFLRHCLVTNSADQLINSSSSTADRSFHAERKSQMQISSQTDENCSGMLQERDAMFLMHQNAVICNHLGSACTTSQSGRTIRHNVQTTLKKIICKDKHLNVKKSEGCLCNLY